jgi:hypothetical protein
MLSKQTAKRNALINDLTKNAAIMITVHLLTVTRAGGKYFDEASVYGIILTLLAFIFYHLVFSNVVPALPTA